MTTNISSYPTLHAALKSVVSDTEPTDWREASKLGYTHDLIEVYYSKDSNCHIVALANNKGKHRASIAGRILSAAVANKDVLFFADKWQGYIPIGRIRAVDYDKKCAKLEVPGDRFTDDMVGLLSKATIADHVFYQDVIQDSCSRNVNQSFAESSRWVGWSKSFTNPTAQKMEELAMQWNVDIKLTAKGWYVEPHKE